MLNFNQERDFNESVITFSHEVAHNFGASHDDGFKDNPECFNKGYIMDELFNTTTSDLEGEFFIYKYIITSTYVVFRIINNQNCK